MPKPKTVTKIKPHARKPCVKYWPSIVRPPACVCGWARMAHASQKDKTVTVYLRVCGNSILDVSLNKPFTPKGDCCRIIPYKLRIPKK